jgi:hypothetical protein
VATPLPRFSDFRDAWFVTGAPGQVIGVRNEATEIVIFEAGKMRALPPPAHLSLREGIVDMFMNLRGQILLEASEGVALWTSPQWKALPTPTLGAGETVVATRAVALNNVGQVLLNLRIKGADDVLRDRAMLISEGQTKYLEGKATALSDAGHVAVQEERQGTMQASVYLPSGEYLMGGAYPLGGDQLPARSANHQGRWHSHGGCVHSSYWSNKDWRSSQSIVADSVPLQGEP